MAVGRAAAAAAVVASLCVAAVAVYTLGAPQLWSVQQGAPAARANVLEKRGDHADPDWCEDKAEAGHCKDRDVKEWCSLVCEAYDGEESSCLQSRLDSYCEDVLPGAKARLWFGAWSCAFKLSKRKGHACLDAGGLMMLCHIPDEAEPVHPHHEAMQGIIDSGECDEEEPEDWADHHVHNIYECTDMLPWTSVGKPTRRQPGLSCTDYELKGYCAGGHVLDASMAGEGFNMPEEHCCACGGGNSRAPPIEDATACPESELAVRLARAAYENGTNITQFLPSGFHVVSFHATRRSAEAFVATGDGACWLAFRGSQEASDWLHDAAACWTTNCSASDAHSIGKCGKGFYSQYQSLREAGMIDEVRELLASDACANGLRITGHSLGGALASVAAADFQTLSDNGQLVGKGGQAGSLLLSPANFRTYTFGEPRSLLWYSADWFNARAAKVRWLNWGDPIASGPPPKFGFKHWGRAYEIENGGLFDTENFFKHVPQNYGTSGFWPQNHRLDPYTTRLAESCVNRYRRRRRALSETRRG